VAANWRDLLLAYLHDPPDKALSVLGHEPRSRDNARIAVSDEISRRILKTAASSPDVEASMIERFPMPTAGPSGERAIGPEGGTLHVVHPLSGVYTSASVPDLSGDLVDAGLRSGRVDATTPRSMDWAPMADTPGAIYTGHSRGFLPVAEWLAFRGLGTLPVSGRGAAIRTTACKGRRLEGEFVWPLWEAPTGRETTRSLLAWPGLDRLGPDALRALGITAVLRANLTKKADGYSGMFSPARSA